ncbi:hypothetical protein VDGD_20647 [Verticillium dahliae]|nr:hypothetical protein VDGD_20647 [Verticillium dahliae]
MPNVDDSVMGRQMPSSFDENHEFYNEKPMAKIFRKLREEPLIPLGTIHEYRFLARSRPI